MTHRRSRPQLKRKGCEMTRMAAKRRKRRKTSRHRTILGVDSAGEVSIHYPTASHRPVVVPTTMPLLILRIDHVVARSAFRVAVAKQQNRAAVMSVGGPLSRSRRIDIRVETPVGFAVRQH